MKAFKAFIKTEVPQIGVKIRIQLNFLSSSGIGAGRVNSAMLGIRKTLRIHIKNLAAFVARFLTYD